MSETSAGVIPTPLFFSGRLTTNSQASGSTTCKIEGRAVSGPLGVPTPECGLVWGCHPGLFHLCWQHLSSWPREAVVTGDALQLLTGLRGLPGKMGDKPKPGRAATPAGEMELVWPPLSWPFTPALPSPPQFLTKLLLPISQPAVDPSAHPGFDPPFPSALSCPVYHPYSVYAEGSSHSSVPAGCPLPPPGKGLAPRTPPRPAAPAKRHVG